MRFRILGPVPARCASGWVGVPADQQRVVLAVLLAEAGGAVSTAVGPSTEGTGIHLPGNAVRALDDLGLSSQVAARAVAIVRQRVADSRGGLLLDLGMVLHSQVLWAMAGWRRPTCPSSSLPSTTRAGSRCSPWSAW